MALALTPFQALCGFRPLPEIASFLKKTPELKSLIPSTILDAFLSISNSSTPTGPEEKGALKNLFSALMTASDNDIKIQLAQLLRRYHQGTSEDDDQEVVVLVQRLASQFPGDIGIFCAFVLNFVKLQPGQAIFLGAGEPHAYVYGGTLSCVLALVLNCKPSRFFPSECIECMANSDNVIRAGLTPKLRDIPNLVSGLTYNASLPTKHVVNSKRFSDGVSILYDPPIPEFSVVQVVLDDRGEKETHRPIKGPSLTIVTKGAGVVSWAGERLEVRKGDVFFVGADTGVGLECGQDGKLTMYRAFVEA